MVGKVAMVVGVEEVVMVAGVGEVVGVGDVAGGEGAEVGEDEIICEVAVVVQPTHVELDVQQAVKDEVVVLGTVHQLNEHPVEVVGLI